MSKASEKAERILNDKRIAFVRKVSTLTGHVARRIPADEMTAAFNAKRTPEDFAAEIASREPVGAALHKGKTDAIKHAGDEARANVERVRIDLEANGWDRNACAPYPYRGSSTLSDLAKMKANHYRMLTKSDGYQMKASRINNEPVIVIMDPIGIARFIEQEERQTALYYDAFIVKMVEKVGEVSAATIEGNHVWSHSILTVTTVDGMQRWKTQQIINYSKFGMPYPQWPSRKI